MREMMFGFRIPFEYCLCSKCGCLQISEPPPDIEKYYPENYYAYENKEVDSVFKISYLRMFLRRHRTNYLLIGKDILGKLTSMVGEDYFGRTWNWDWFRKSKIGLDDEILDVGCGAAQLLFGLKGQGFTKLTGADRYIEKDVINGNIRIYRKQITELNSRFDLIMMHHSFEHMSDPLSVLKAAEHLLKPNRYLLIRIPVMSSYLWQAYGVNWVQIDAPRHFFIHTPLSMGILVKSTGLRLVDTVFD